jgi:hypothetical protein
MSDWKNFFASRTVWANLVGLAALVASSLGSDVPQAEQEAATDALLQVVAGLSFLASIAFRVMARRRLSL